MATVVTLILVLVLAFADRKNNFFLVGLAFV